MRRSGELIYDFHRLANDAIENDAEYSEIINLPVKEKIGRAKYIPENQLEELDTINKEIIDTLKGLINGGDNA